MRNTEDAETEEDVLVQDSSGVKTTMDLKTEIKKPDIKLVGKIDLEKTLSPKSRKPVVPPKEKEEEKQPDKPAEEAKSPVKSPGIRKNSSAHSGT